MPKEKQCKHVIRTIQDQPQVFHKEAQSPETSLNSMKLQTGQQIKKIEIHQSYEETSKARSP